MVRYELITGSNRPRWKTLFREMELGESMKITAKDDAQVACIRAAANQVNRENVHNFFLTVNSDNLIVSVITKNK